MAPRKSKKDDCITVSSKRKRVSKAKEEVSDSDDDFVDEKHQDSDVDTDDDADIESEVEDLEETPKKKARKTPTKKTPSKKETPRKKAKTEHKNIHQGDFVSKTRQPRGQTYFWDEHNADHLAETSYTAVEDPQPEGLRMQLLPFQRESLHWMIEQEHDPERNGGILADDMGMGKTLQAISLLLKNREVSNGVKTTLVVCPVVALVQWHTEILKYTRENELSVYLYHGSDRPTLLTEKEKLTAHDVVLTTYSTVEADHRYEVTGRRRKGEDGEPYYVKRPSLLHSIHWHRIILDEAHSIKDRQCQTARSVFSLEGSKRWLLTGTPLQNRVGELYSLIRFLRITPFSYYYCKKCPCKSLWWKFVKADTKGDQEKKSKDGKVVGKRAFGGKRNCEDCNHSAMSHFAWWNRNVMNPIIKRGPTSEEGTQSMWNLKCILQRIMLRRTKQERAEDMCLPPRVIKVRHVELDDEENDFYEALYTQSKTKFMGYVQAGTVLNNYAHVFDLLLRLRQAVDHPFLVLHSKEGDGKYGAGACCICYEPAEDAIKSQCDHVFCRMCATNHVEGVDGNQGSNVCPACHRALTINLNQESITAEGSSKKSKTKSILQRVDLSHWRSSSKIEALMEELTRTRQRDPNAKSLVFSQFVNFLDLIDWRLRLGGFKCVKLDGRLNIEAKNAAIRQFYEDPETSVFLISLKAGGLALNLTIASNCYLLDPWWNPAAEMQAIDRIYRLGQTKCISVTRFIIPNTIESRIVALQKKKDLIFQSTVGGDNDALAKLTVDDLKFLFL